jgi:glutathione S-transferase
MEKISLYGVVLSPYVRKVRLALDFKGVDYEKIPVMPIPGADKPAEFLENSPLGKIPLLRVNDDYLADSTIMCAWLERAHPEPVLVSADPMQAAKTLWFEEYMSSKMAPAIGGHLFAELVLAKNVFGREPIQADIDLALGTEIPAIFDYLTEQLKSDYLMGDSVTLADIAVGSQFLTLSHCNYVCDAAVWPEVAAYIERMMGLEIFKNALSEEQQFLQAFGS